MTELTKDETISLNESDEVRIQAAKIKKSKSAKTIVMALDKMAFSVKQKSETQKRQEML